MTTPDIAGLCERLRAAPTSTLIASSMVPVLRNPDGPEAANTIERQTAEIERLRGALTFYANRKIYEDTEFSRSTEAGDDEGRKARAALTGEDHD